MAILGEAIDKSWPPSEPRPVNIDWEVVTFVWEINAFLKMKNSFNGFFEKFEQSKPTHF